MSSAIEDSGPLMVGLIGAAGLGVVAATQGNTRLATEIPFALLVGALLARRPAGTITLLFLLAGTYGTFAAFLPIFPALQVADLLLAALWIGVGYSYLYGVRTRPVHFLPG